MSTENQVTLNGEPRSFASGTTLFGLIQALELPPERLAIELDSKIVKREFWDSTVVDAGARIEIVQFVGGG